MHSLHGGTPPPQLSRSGSHAATALPTAALQPHLIQVNLALGILEIQLQGKSGHTVLADLEVPQVGNSVDILGKQQDEYWLGDQQRWQASALTEHTSVPSAVGVYKPNRGSGGWGGGTGLQEKREGQG